MDSFSRNVVLLSRNLERAVNLVMMLIRQFDYEIRWDSIDHLRKNVLEFCADTFDPDADNFRSHLEAIQAANLDRLRCDNEWASKLDQPMAGGLPVISAHDAAVVFIFRVTEAIYMGSRETPRSVHAIQDEFDLLPDPQRLIREIVIERRHLEKWLNNQAGDSRSPVTLSVANKPDHSRIALNEPKRLEMQPEQDVRPEFSPPIRSEELMQVMRTNKVGGKISERSIARWKRNWGAVEQPGSNGQAFRLNLKVLRNGGYSYPPEWDRPA